MKAGFRKIFTINNEKYVFFCEDLEIIKIINNNILHKVYAEKAQSNNLLTINHNYEIKFDKNNIRVLSINLVNGCNLNCNYCFIGAYQRKNQLLSEIQLRNILHFFSSDTMKDIVLFFSGGGEPLLNFKLLKKIPEICCEYNLRPIHGELNTNGTLLTDEMVYFFKKNKFAVNVSIDGNRESHDITRKYHNGKSSFNDALRGIERLKKHKVDFAAKTVIIPNNNKIIEAFDFFEENNYPFVFDISTPSVTGHFNPSLKDLDNFAIQFNAIIDKYVYKIINNQKIYALKIINDLKKIHSRKRRIFGCSASMDSVHIDIDGSIYPCAYRSSSNEFAIGNVNQGLFLDKIKQQWHAKPINELPKCFNCWLISICGGACFAIKWLKHHDIETPHSYLCKYYDIYWFNLITLYIQTYNALTDEKNINYIP
jgi:uncharacterized protein